MMSLGTTPSSVVDAKLLFLGKAVCYTALLDMIILTLRVLFNDTSLPRSGFP